MVGKISVQRLDRPKTPWGIILILLAFIGLSFAYSVVNPLHEATDELRHYRFVRTIATTGRLPIQGEEPCRSQSHHPPLFYALGALATAWIDTERDICATPAQNPFWAYRYWEVGRDNKNQYLANPGDAFPWHGEALAAHILRGLNVLIGAGVVLLTWLIARTIWPDRPGISLGAAALVAFNPMFLYMAGAINNDIIAALTGAAVVYACVRLLAEPSSLSWRWGIIFGIVYGLALMSKFNLAATIVLIEGAVTWAALKTPVAGQESAAATNQTRSIWLARLKMWLVVNFMIVLVSGLLAGWWFVRNQVLFGEPTGFEQVTELWGVRDPRESFGLAISELPYAWTTLWGRFGFGQIPLPLPIYAGLLILTAAGISGAAFGFIWRGTPRERLNLAFLAADVGLFFLVLFNYMLVSPAGPNGRFFFPALAALAVLIMYGLSQLLVEVGHLLRPDKDVGESGHAPKPGSPGWFPKILSLGMFSLAVVALLAYLKPAYARPPTIPAETSIPNEINVQFDHLATLLGYELSTAVLEPGEPVDIDLYWEVNAQPPGNYLLFVHLMDGAQTMVAQRDTHPGLGRFPSSLWQGGDRFMDSIRLYVPETAYAPETAQLRIGLYAPDGYRLAVSTQDNQPLGDSFILGTIKLDSPPGPMPNPQDQNFGDRVRLVGYEYDRRTLKPGEPLTVTLFWENAADGADDYLVHLGLIAEDGREWIAAEDELRILAASNEETADEQMTSATHSLLIPPDAPPGRYTVVLSVRPTGAGETLNIVAADGHLIDSKLDLAQVRVLE